MLILSNDKISCNVENLTVSLMDMIFNPLNYTINYPFKRTINRNKKENFLSKKGTNTARKIIESGIEIRKFRFFKEPYLNDIKDELEEKYFDIEYSEKKMEWNKACMLMGDVLETCLSTWIEYENQELKMDIEEQYEGNLEWEKIGWYIKMIRYIYWENCQKSPHYDWEIIPLVFNKARNNTHIFGTHFSFQERHYRMLRPLFNYLIGFF